MKPKQKLIAVLAILLFAPPCFGQAISDYDVGPYFSFLSSPKFKSSPGLGLAFGQQAQRKISNNLELLTEFSIHGSGMTIKGFTFGGIDKNGNQLYNDAQSKFLKIGISYMVGVNYYITPDALSVNGGIELAENSLINIPPDDNYIGTASKDPYQNNYYSSSVASSATGFDYGIHLGLNYRIKYFQFGLGYFIGLNNQTPDVGFTSTYNDIDLTFHYALFQYSIAKDYQNKLLK